MKREGEMIRKTVALDKELLEELNLFAKKDQRDFSGALRYALKIGLAAIENPELTIEEIKDIFEAAVDLEAGRVSELSLNEI
jgi:metal-responsive CopG/Arc/MetJ family transcriptional regulator